MFNTTSIEKHHATNQPSLTAMNKPLFGNIHGYRRAAYASPRSATQARIAAITPYILRRDSLLTRISNLGR